MVSSAATSLDYAEGKAEEATYERRFIRGPDVSKDKCDSIKRCRTWNNLVYGDGRLWGIINGASFTPDRTPSIVSCRSTGIA
jgi:hypothetical protein